MNPLTRWFERIDASEIHIFSLYWQQRYRSILCRRKGDDYIVESIDGHPANLFPEGLRTAAQRHFKRTE